MKAILVCGARPNFMKVAPLLRAISKHNARFQPNEPNELLEPLPPSATVVGNPDEIRVWQHIHAGDPLVGSSREGGDKPRPYVY